MLWSQIAVKKLMILAGSTETNSLNSVTQIVMGQ